MQFHFPQYIDIEDKIFGPLTLKQAIFTAGGIGGAYLVFVYIPYIFISVPIIFAVGVLTWALAFYPKEKLGRPFIDVMEAGFWYFMSNKLYTWKKTTREPPLGKEEEFLPSGGPVTPLIPQGKLSSSSFTIDVRGPEGGKDEERDSVPLGSFASAASAEAGTISADSFVLDQKIPKVNTFVKPEKIEHSPYKTPPASAPHAGGSTQASGSTARAEVPRSPMQGLRK